MAKGASQRSGPAPDPNALHREKDAADWISLPKSGRKGPIPKWPLEDQTDRERIFWQRQWNRPQAVMWEAAGQEEEVAIYVRTLGQAEKLDASTASRTLLRQQMEALGISIPGMMRNRWKIEDSRPGEVHALRPKGVSARDRLASA